MKLIKISMSMGVGGKGKGEKRARADRRGAEKILHKSGGLV